MSHIQTTMRLYRFDDAMGVYNCCAVNSPVINSEATEFIDVRSCKLDSVLAKTKAQNIFSKVDVEGHEFKVLSGGRNGLAASKNFVVMCELCEPAARAHGDSTRRAIDLMQQLGFSMLVFDGEQWPVAQADHFSAIATGSAFPDVFFVRSKC